MTGTLILLLTLVFAAAGVAKLRAPNPFEASLRKLVAKPFVEPLSLTIPIAELLLAIWLISGRAPRPAAWTAAALLTFFTLVLIRMWRIGLKGCGCFGEQAEGGGMISGMVRNLLLIATAVVVATGPADAPVFDHTLPGLVGQLTVVLGSVCLWLIGSAVASRWKWIAPRRIAV